MAQAFFPVLYNAIGQLGTTSDSGADSSCQDLPLVPAACTPGAAEQELAVAVQPLLKQPGRSGLERKSYQGLLKCRLHPASRESHSASTQARKFFKNVITMF